MFFEDNEKNFPELKKFKLGDLKWDALNVFQDIMKVGTVEDRFQFHDTQRLPCYAGPTCFPTATIS